MKPRLLATLTCLALIAASTKARGAEESFLVDMWDVERGLPSGTVTGVMQAPDGFLWLSTLNGLVRFDGVRLDSFLGSRTPGLKMGGFNEIVVSGSGEVWALAEDGQLVFRDKSGFKTLKKTGQGDAVQSLQSDTAGAVWATQANGAIARCAEAEVQVVAHSQEFGGLACPPVTLPDGAAWLVTSNGTLLEWKQGQLLERHPPGPNGQRLVVVSLDQLGSVWVLGPRAIWQWRAQQWTPVALPANTTMPFRGLIMGRNSDVWVWSKEGIWRLQQGEWTAAAGPWPPVAGGFNPNAQLVDAEGRAWFGTRGQGLVAVSASGKIPVLSIQQGLPSNYIKCLAKDHEGNVWAGTDRGLVRIKPKRLTVISWDDPQGEAMATGLAEGINGRLWMGSYSDGLLRLDGPESRAKAQVAFASPKSCRALVFDGKDRLWVGTVQEGLWTLEDGRLSQVVNEAQLPAGQARSLLADSRGRLWIGTTKGLFSFADGKLTPHATTPELGDIDVRAMVENSDGSLWVGTERHGLLRWRDEVWKKDPLSLPTSLLSIWSLYEDRSGDLWIGTEDGGLARWRAGHLDLFNRTNGLAADTVCAILEDDRDTLWLGTYEGIFRLKKSECDAVAASQLSKLLPEIFTRSEGMPTLECTGSFQPSACRTHDGRLCFPTIKGVVMVDPRLEAPPSIPPPVLIEEVMLGNRSLEPESEMRLGPRPKRIAFRFTAPSFRAPERVRFRYRLDGEDKEWIDAGADRSAVFDTLPPGRHEFRVTACSADGIWNEQGASLAFMVVPIWWQTWWFQGAAVSGAVLLVAAILRQVLTRRFRQRLELAQRQAVLDRERSRIARDIHDELGTSLTRIVMLSQPDDEDIGIFDQKLSLSKIHETAGALTRAMDEVVWAVNPRQDTLEGLVSYISVFAQEFISAANLVCRLDLPTSVPPVPLSAEVRHSVFLAVKEAVNNAVRHARAREIRLTIRAETLGFTLEVADDGIGF
ncbi:MAG TPA: two-component regulator propeller domain-containing protein, partial [Candidatus Cybelea sp.]|nr:two-component regulator propeller domain-containing protein [Candidatus Cybelea sp.]